MTVSPVLVLIVRQTQRVHAEIDLLLAELEAIAEGEDLELTYAGGGFECRLLVSLEAGSGDSTWTLSIISGMPSITSSRERKAPCMPISSATEAPSRASPTARFTATVVLPTPPLPLPTARMVLIGTSSFSRMRLSARTSESKWMRIWPMPGRSRRRALSLSLCSTCFRGQAGVVSMIVKLTAFSSMRMSRTKLRVTRSWCSSGSITVPRAFSTCSLDIVCMAILKYNKISNIWICKWTISYR